MLLKYIMFGALIIFQVNPIIAIRVGVIIGNYYTDSNRNYQKDFSFLKPDREDKVQGLRHRLAFEFSIDMLNKRKFSFAMNQTFTYNIASFATGFADAYRSMNHVCRLLSVGVAAIISSSSDSIIRSTCAVKHMPHILTSQAKATKAVRPRQTYTLQIAPSMIMWNKVIFDLAIYFKWREIALLYCEDPSEIELLVDALTRQQNMEVTVLRVARVDGTSYIDTLSILQKKRIKRVIFYCNRPKVMLDVLTEALPTGALNDESHYILFGMNSCFVLRDNHYIFGRYRILALSVTDEQFSKTQIIRSLWNKFIQTSLNNQHKRVILNEDFQDLLFSNFTEDTALMYDALHVYAKALSTLITSTNLRFSHRSLPCTSDKTWFFGKDLMQSLLSVDYTGMTGRITFGQDGERTNITINILSISYHGLKKIGQWNSENFDVFSFNNVKGVEKRLTMETNSDNKKSSSTTVSLTNATLVVSIIVEEPYVFKKKVYNKDENVFEESYYGYCIDLLNLLSKDLQFSYTLREVPDHNYGDIKPDGSWDGMIGELTKKHADLAVAPLTITYDRERVVRFTKPYMSFGVSILFQKPTTEHPNIFGFLEPLSPLIWVLVFIAYVAVAFIMFCIARLSPDISDNMNDNCSSGTNNFSILDSLWFGIGALMQQGSDLTLKSTSTRLLAGVWWFFTLILISSYTANLAAFLTVTRMETAISSVDDLVAQSTVKYGTLKHGATASFFRNSKIRTYAQIWKVLNQTQDLFALSKEEGIKRVFEGNYAYLMESSTLEYIVNDNCNLTQVGGLLDTRGYGIATMDSSLRDELSVSILKLQEKGLLDELKHKWWEENATKCLKEDNSSTQSLTLSNLGGAFMFLCFGAALSILTAAIEFLMHSYSGTKLNLVKNEFESELSGAQCRRRQILKKHVHLHKMKDRPNAECPGTCCLFLVKRHKASLMVPTQQQTEQLQGWYRDSSKKILQCF
ncbi:glutamate receptor ionotropic, kainate 2-like isoform X2 [Clavelina lepadiformis]|uniref:glutamate receptor ionotropic, kainate 2-like isoform X2 n=1 Tax=Clavelina lepadiformis TaxID=159417 RepID=UPI004041E44B